VDSCYYCRQTPVQAGLRLLDNVARGPGTAFRRRRPHRCDTGRRDHRAGQPDFVVIATGGEKIVPGIAGINLPHVHDAWESTRRDGPPGVNVLVIGGGLIGMETADYLCSKVTTLTVVEALKHSPVSKLTSHGYMLHRRFEGCRLCPRLRRGGHHDRE
jgi:hypothetical protein